MRALLISLFLPVSLTAASHPKLLFPASREAEIDVRIREDSLAARLQRQVLLRAEKVLGERTCEHRIPDGLRLLRESRLAFHNVVHCAWAWRTTGEERFRARAIRELDAACALKDWNPKHFLDVGEMCAAVALGYDWLYPSLTAEQRGRYGDALIGKGLKTLPTKPPAWWRGASNNWTQVCAAGIGLAAEAVREREPELAAQLTAHCMKLIQQSIAFYQPDGCYPEGPDYWHYGTNYDVLFRAAREALGQPMGFPREFAATGEFMRQVYGPTGVCFNFADGNPGRQIPSPAQTWIARQDPATAGRHRQALERALDAGMGDSPTGDLRFLPLQLLWLPPAGESPDGPMATTFGGEQAMAFFRTGWKEDAAWLAIKGGTGSASHGHMDAGSFVYEAKGVRWFHDLGKDDYTLPGYFQKQRWDYLRMTNLSHNTLVIGGGLQSLPEQGCPIIAKKLGGHIGSVVFDLTTAYAGQAGKVIRKASFNHAGGEVLLQDAITDATGPVRWAVVTRAVPTIDGRKVLLEENGRKLVLERRDDLGGEWGEYSIKPKSDRENQNDGYRMIGFTVSTAGSGAIKVAWKPL